MSDRMLRRSIDVQIRGIDEEKRQATFIASTENPVETWNGPEVLRMKGAKLKRYKRNPVLLDTHGRYRLEDVIGSTETTVEGRKLVSVATYATTPSGENAWQLVKGGHVRAMSIGYAVNRKKVRVLTEGQHDGEGADRVDGPAMIVNEWELLEVSNVPVPADADAVRRAFYQEDRKGARMPRPEIYEEGAAGAQDSDEGERAAPPPPAAPPRPAAKPAPRVVAVTELDEERALRAERARADTILARTPEGSSLREFAMGLVESGVDVATAHKSLIEEKARRFKPIGTPEPAAITTPTGETSAQRELDAFTPDAVLKAVTGLRSL